MTRWRSSRTTSSMLAALAVLAFAASRAQPGRADAAPTQAVPINRAHQQGAGASLQPNRLTIPGSPLTIHVGSNADVQVYHRNYMHGQVFGDADSGIFLWINGDLYGSNLLGTETISFARDTLDLTAVSHSGPTGSGTPASPWEIRTLLRAGTTGIDILQRIRYVDGEPYFSLIWTLQNNSASSVSLDFFHATDLYFADSDYGFGYYDPRSGSVGGYDRTQSWYMIFVPMTPVTHYQEAFFGLIWGNIGECTTPGSCRLGPGFDDTISSDLIDNGAGLQWHRTLAPEESAEVGDWWSFSTLPVIPPTPTRTPTVPSPTPTRTPTITPSPTPGPVTVVYVSSPGDLIYRVDGSQFTPYRTSSASDSSLNRMTSPPAPREWQQPGFVPDASWRPGSEVRWGQWSSPGWGSLPSGSRPIGLLAANGVPEGKSAITQLYHRAFDLTAPAPGWQITRAVLEMWSDNKTEWWWQGRSIAYDRQAYIGQIELFPGYLSHTGGRYVLAVQNSNDSVCPDNDYCNPQGTAFRLAVTWERASVLPLYLPAILRNHRPTPVPTPTATHTRLPSATPTQTSTPTPTSAFFYPLIEEFDSADGFTQTSPNVTIRDGQVVWSVCRGSEQQFVYRSIQPFSGNVRVTVRGQIDLWDSDCEIVAGIGNVAGTTAGNGWLDGIGVSYRWFGGGCPNQSQLVQALGVTGLDCASDGCSFVADCKWWVRGGVPYTLILEIRGNTGTLTAEGIASGSGTVTYGGEYNILYVGRGAGGDWPCCSGTIDWIKVEPL